MMIGVIGLGHMGGSAARTLQASNKAVIGYDLDASRRLAAEGAGVTCSLDSRDVFESCEIVLLSLPKPEHVLSIMALGGPVGAMTPGGIIVDLSTISPAAAREAAALAKNSGVDYIDAPVLGRPNTCSRWTLSAGGPERVVDRVKPLLTDIAPNIVRVGEVGAGNAFKLLNNMMVGAINAITGEILASCSSVGIDPHVFVETVSQSGAASVSNLFLELAPRIVERDFRPTFSLELLHKDNDLYLQMLRDAGLQSIVGRAVQDLNERASELGYGDSDLGVVTRAFDELNVGAQ